MSYENAKRENVIGLKTVLKIEYWTRFKKNPPPTEYNKSFTITHRVEAEFMT